MKEDSTKKCQSCGSDIKENYCSKCGEKIVHETDFSIGAILSQSFSTITNLDSKLFRTFSALLFKPGRLSLEYINGRRKLYMQPFQVFVLLNLLFFFITDVDMFRVPSQWYFEDPGRIVRGEEVAQSKNITYSEVLLLYDTQVAAWSKSAVIVTIPFIGLIMLLLNFKKKYLFGKHLIFATHFFSFFLLFTVLLYIAVILMPYKNKYFFQIPTLLSMFIYLVFSIKQFYKDKIVLSIIKSFVGTLAILAIFLLYRYLISAFTLWSL